MKKLFSIKEIIAAVVVIFALSLTSCKKDGKSGENEGGEDPENPEATNYKNSYTKSDYYHWDAYSPIDKSNSGKWESGSSFYHDGEDVLAEASCKGICDYETAKLYLAQEVYWDEAGLEYSVDGSKPPIKNGLWVIKKEYIPKNAVGREIKTVEKLSELTETEQNNIRKGGKFFFLPAAGYYYDSSFGNVGVYGYYWLSTSNGSNVYILGFNSNVAVVANHSRGSMLLRLFAE